MFHTSTLEAIHTRKLPPEALCDELKRILATVGSTMRQMDDVSASADWFYSGYKDWLTKVDATIGELNTTVLEPAGFRLCVSINVRFMENWSRIECLEHDATDEGDLRDLIDAPQEDLLMQLNIPMLPLIVAAWRSYEQGTEFPNIHVTNDF
jgi:hypothetical protein